MKRTYPIREWKAIEQFRSRLSNDPGTIEMVLSLADIAQLLRRGVSQLPLEPKSGCSRYLGTMKWLG